MSVEHSFYAPSPQEKQPEFLSVKPGDYVIVRAQQKVAQKSNEDWFMGQVVFCEGGARDPRVNTMFQVADVDTGVITWVNGDEVVRILVP